MTRYPHYWWSLKGAYCPSRIAVLVCDTAGRPGLGGPQPCPVGVPSWHIASTDMRHGAAVRLAQRSGEGGGRCVPALASLCSGKETTWLFVPGAVDTLTALGFWGELESHQWELVGRDWRVDRGDGHSGEDKTDGLCCIEDPPTLILCRPAGAKGKLLILDTRNYGIELLCGPERLPDRASWYLEGLLRVVRTLRQDTPVSLRGTAASQAVQILRTHYDCVRLHCHTNPCATALERAAYYGGRVEAYRTGEIPGPVYHLDVRSMYPSIGLTLSVPVSIREYADGCERASRLVERYPGECVADVSIESVQPAYPARRDAGIVFPVGCFDTHLAGPELEHARGAGFVVRCHRACRYYCAPILSGFYEWGLGRLDAARAAGDEVLCQWLKRVMNALIGKFGEPGRRWVARPSITEMGPYAEFEHPGPDGIPVRHRNIAWNTQRLETHGESYWSVPAIAAFITSAARLRLWDYLTAAGRENVWYVDTDGLLCGQTGYDRLLRGGHIRSGEAGHLRLIGCHSRCTIYGIRHYQLGDTVKCAGVPHGSIGEGQTREDWFRLNPAATTSVVERIRRSIGGSDE